MILPSCQTRSVLSAVCLAAHAAHTKISTECWGGVLRGGMTSGVGMTSMSLTSCRIYRGQRMSIVPQSQSVLPCHSRSADWHRKRSGVDPPLCSSRACCHMAFIAFSRPIVLLPILPGLGLGLGSTKQPTNQPSTNQPKTSQPTNQTHQPTSQPTNHQPNNQPAKQSPSKQPAKQTKQPRLPSHGLHRFLSSSLVQLAISCPMA